MKRIAFVIDVTWSVGNRLYVPKRSMIDIAYLYIVAKEKLRIMVEILFNKFIIYMTEVYWDAILHHYIASMAGLSFSFFLQCYTIILYAISIY